MFFNGLYVLTVLSLLGNNGSTTITIPSESSYSVQIMNNLENYDMQFTKIAFDNLTNSATFNFSIFSDTNDNIQYGVKEVKTGEDYISGTPSIYSTASNYESLFINNPGEQALTISWDNVYLVASENNTSENVGNTIVDSITAGLGLMNPISNEFLTGFSTLFWDVTANSGAGGLTTFGNFALIFMGVSITFAVVKLALNLIRGKTGA